MSTAAVAAEPRGESGDVELFRATLAPDSLPGMDVPANQRAGTWRWGTGLTYASSPLVLYAFDQRVGDVISNRLTGWVGASVDVSRALTLRLVAPVVGQWGTDVPRLAAGGFGLGDLSVGGHLVVLRGPHGGLGLRVDLSTPTGRRDAWSGDALPRVEPGLLAALDVGRVRLAADVGLLVRFRGIATDADLSLGSELVARTGARVRVILERLDVGLVVVTRLGLADPTSDAALASEGLLDLGIKVAPWLWMDAGGGRGFTRGYGTSDGRAWLGLRFQRVPRDLGDVPPPTPPPEPPLTDGDDTIIDVFPQAPSPSPAPAPPRVTTVLDGPRPHLALDDEIRFERASARLMPEGELLLAAVAEVLNADGRIGHVVVVGQSSPEGEVGANHALAFARAESVWRWLLEHGVHPDRVSTTSRGEVAATVADDDVAALAAERRVLFRITEVLGPLDEPDWAEVVRLPWSGEEVRPARPRPGEP